MRRLTEFSRLILFDKRGTGLSDRPSVIDVEHWMEDIVAVMDAAGSKRAAVLGMSAGSPIATQFAASYPERVSALVLYGGFARMFTAPDYPIGFDRDKVKIGIDRMEAESGTGSRLHWFCPSLGDDPAARELFGRYERKAASPGSASTYIRALHEIDVRPALTLVSVPTLVVHANGDRSVPLALGRYVADHIPHAKLVALDSSDHLIWFSDAIAPMTAAIEEFLLSDRGTDASQSVLLTVLAVDVVDATAVRSTQIAIERARGRVVETPNDSRMIATFDGPARAVRCATALAERLMAAGVFVRAGLHSGECVLDRDRVRGGAVDVAAQVASAADVGEVLVSRTVTDLVVASDLAFTERGVPQFTGAPEARPLFEVSMR